MGDSEKSKEKEVTFDKVLNHESTFIGGRTGNGFKGRDDNFHKGTDVESKQKRPVWVRRACRS